MEFREIGKVEKERALEEFGSAEKRRVLREFSVGKGTKGEQGE